LLQVQGVGDMKMNVVKYVVWMKPTDVRYQWQILFGFYCHSWCSDMSSYTQLYVIYEREKNTAWAKQYMGKLM
jgi:hypothetical protein